MTADLLRQLDAYGDHIETLIEHVDVDEIRQRALLADARRSSPRRRWVRPVVLGTSSIAVLLVVILGMNFLPNSVDSNFSAEFSEIGLALEDDGAGVPSPADPQLAGLRPAESPEISGFSEFSAELRPAQDTPTPSTPPPAPPTTAAPAAVEPSEVEPTGDPQAGRDIVFVADVRVSVSDAQDAGDRATLIVESLGGFLSGEKSTGGANATNVITFKVPPSAFRDAVDRLGELGVVSSREVTADDVTDRVVDLESQIASSEVSVERLRTFLAAAANVNDVAKLEKELTNRERDLEQLRGQLKTLEDRVSLATIRVTFTEAIQNPKVQISTGAYPAQDDEGARCLGVRPLEIEAGEDATVCIQIVNNGKTQLTDIELTGPAAELLTGNLIAVEGDLDGILEVGGVVVIATDIAVDARIREDLTVTAVPINEAGDPVPDRSVTQTKRIAIDIADPGGLPGFGDAWDSGAGALATAGSLVLIVLGAILPWLWLPALVFGFVWWRRRR